MKKDIKLALKSDHMNKNIVAKPAVVSQINPWSSMHWHDFYELEIILSGQGKVVCNNSVHSVKAGMVSFLTPVDIHKYIVDVDFKTICIQFTDNSISAEILELFLNVEKNVIYLEDDKLRKLMSLCDLLISDISEKTFNDLYQTKLLEAMLLSLKTKFGTANTNYKLSPQTMQKALSYINTHFKENPKMSDVAKILYLNENYFCSLFKENMGEGYKEYLRKLKLNHAKNLIFHTDLPLTQISFECGYSSQSNFNRDFKAFFGSSPKGMRQEQIKKA